ncbi:MAG TPA: GNAT family N-acetyltransferase [Bacteroidia bacterium]|nr:GNAT family N-acetyltransferase [Bacteroidia bacterium]
MSEIRQAVLQDVEQLSGLFNQYRIFYKKESDPEAAQLFLHNRMKNHESVIFLALQENILAGFVQLYPLFSSTRLKRLWLLNDLFVLPDYRGSRISVELIEKCKTHCIQTDACGLILETAMDNSIGNTLYPRTGFTLDTEFNRYYWDA